jgi:hypothetical protein
MNARMKPNVGRSLCFAHIRHRGEREAETTARPIQDLLDGVAGIQLDGEEVGRK